MSRRPSRPSCGPRFLRARLAAKRSLLTALERANSVGSEYVTASGARLEYIAEHEDSEAEYPAN